MPRLTIAVTCTALALALGACGKDDESQTGRDAGGDSATVTTNPTPEAVGTSTQSDAGESNDPVSIGMKDIKFEPAEASAKVGQKVIWTNNESVPHNVTAKKGADFKSDTLNKDETFEYTPEKAGTIDYVCTIHPGQNGTLTVTK